MDVPGFEPVIGRELVAGDVREEDFMLALTFDGGYRCVIVPPPAKELATDSVPRWRITTPTGVIALEGNTIRTKT
jgi:hypothetical protein